LAALSRRPSQNRVEVQFVDLRHLFDQERDASEDLFQSLRICRLMSPVAFQQTITAKLAPHVTGIAVGERGDAKAHVARELDVHAAETESRAADAQRARQRTWKLPKTSGSAGSSLALACTSIGILLWQKRIPRPSAC
jgi:hypothetical protein